ncbi:uncharacterized protein [Salvelinus alpinus]|uniref:uncharacterized protein isoform X1 n=2 Tax=Salvelinus alpinus TaxID=8036 RepID=UPI0039FDB236
MHKGIGTQLEETHQNHRHWRVSSFHHLTCLLRHLWISSDLKIYHLHWNCLTGAQINWSHLAFAVRCSSQVIWTNVRRAMASVCVAVRVRPLNKREKEMSAKVIIHMEGNTTSVDCNKKDIHKGIPGSGLTDGGRHSFSYDFSYDSTDVRSPNFVPQEKVFKDLGCDVLKAAFEGYNACVFVYGQTGSGKSYTMIGSPGDLGLIPRICDGLFCHISEMDQVDGASFRTEVSYLEIYNERVQDLLTTKTGPGSGSGLHLREHPKDGPYVENLSTRLVQNYTHIEELMHAGNAKRTKANTGMNDVSSRSHSSFTIIFTQVRFDAELPCETVSKIHLVDLAGSERTGARLKEGANINKSLVTLGSVISALADTCVTGGGSSHTGKMKKKQLFIPYRDSLLTWLLKNSLGGNSNTIMIATLSPADVHYGETLSTLRYANRAKNIVNKPTVNEDSGVRVIRELQEEIGRLRGLMEDNHQAPLSPQVLSNTLKVEEKLHNNEAQVLELTKEWTSKLGETQNILKEGRTLVGRHEAPSNQDIVIHDAGLQEEHCVFENCDGVVKLIPQTGALCSVNGLEMTRPCQLTQGAVIQLGRGTMFRFIHPKETAQLREQRKSGLLSSLSVTDLSEPTENLSVTDLSEPTENLSVTDLSEPTENLSVTDLSEPTENLSVTDLSEPTENLSEAMLFHPRMDMLAVAGLNGDTGQQRSSVLSSPLQTWTVMRGDEGGDDSGTEEGTHHAHFPLASSSSTYTQTSRFDKHTASLSQLNTQTHNQTEHAASRLDRHRRSQAVRGLPLAALEGQFSRCMMNPSKTTVEGYGDNYKEETQAGARREEEVEQGLRLGSLVSRVSSGDETQDESQISASGLGALVRRVSQISGLGGEHELDSLGEERSISGMGSVVSSGVSWMFPDMWRLLHCSPSRVLQQFWDSTGVVQPRDVGGACSSWPSQVVSMVRESLVLSVVKDSQVFSLVRESHMFSYVKDRQMFSIVSELPLVQHISTELTHDFRSIPIELTRDFRSIPIELTRDFRSIPIELTRDFRSIPIELTRDFRSIPIELTRDFRSIPIELTRDFRSIPIELTRDFRSIPIELTRDFRSIPIELTRDFRSIPIELTRDFRSIPIELTRDFRSIPIELTRDFRSIPIELTRDFRSIPIELTQDLQQVESTGIQQRAIDFNTAPKMNLPLLTTHNNVFSPGPSLYPAQNATEFPHKQNTGKELDWRTGEQNPIRELEWTPEPEGRLDAPSTSEVRITTKEELWSPEDPIKMEEDPQCVTDGANGSKPQCPPEQGNNARSAGPEKSSVSGQEKQWTEGVQVYYQRLVEFPGALVQLQSLPLSTLLGCLQSVLPSVLTSQRLIALYWLGVANCSQPHPHPSLVLLLESCLYALTLDPDRSDQTTPLTVFHHLPLLQIKEILVGFCGQSLRLTASTEESVLTLYTHSQTLTQALTQALLGVFSPGDQRVAHHPFLKEDLMELSLDWKAQVPDLLLDAGLRLSGHFHKTLADLVYILHGNMGREKPSLGEVRLLLYTTVGVTTTPDPRPDPWAQLLLTETHLGLVQENAVFHPAPRHLPLLSRQAQFQGVSLRCRSDIRCLMVGDWAGSSPGVGRDGAGSSPGVGRDGAGSSPGVGRDGAGSSPGVGRDGAGSSPGVGRDGAGSSPGVGRDGAGSSPGVGRDGAGSSPGVGRDGAGSSPGVGRDGAGSSPGVGRDGAGIEVLGGAIRLDIILSRNRRTRGERWDRPRGQPGSAAAVRKVGRVAEVAILYAASNSCPSPHQQAEVWKLHFSCMSEAACLINHLSNV